MRTPALPRAALLVAALSTLAAPVGCKAAPNEGSRRDTTRGAARAGSASPAAASGAGVDLKAEADTIRAIGERWNQMLAARDTVGIGGLFAADGAEFVPNAPAARGPSGVRRSIAAMYGMGKDVRLAFDPADVTVAQSDDEAVERGTYQLSMTDARGRKIADHGNYVTVWKKVNGQWKVWADITASEVPIP